MLNIAAFLVLAKNVCWRPLHFHCAYCCGTCAVFDMWMLCFLTNNKKLRLKFLCNTYWIYVRISHSWSEGTFDRFCVSMFLIVHVMLCDRLWDAVQVTWDDGRTGRAVGRQLTPRQWRGLGGWKQHGQAFRTFQNQGLGRYVHSLQFSQISSYFSDDHAVCGADISL